MELTENIFFRKIWLLNEIFLYQIFDMLKFHEIKTRYQVSQRCFSACIKNGKTKMYATADFPHYLVVNTKRKKYEVKKRLKFDAIIRWFMHHNVDSCWYLSKFFIAVYDVKASITSHFFRLYKCGWNDFVCFTCAKLCSVAEMKLFTKIPGRHIF